MSQKKLPSTIGLIAGNGRLPLLFGLAARKQGIRVVAVASKGDTSLWIYRCADEVRWFTPGEVKKYFSFLRSRGITHVLMAGQINPDTLFRSHQSEDSTYQSFFSALRDRRCDTIFGAFADLLKSEGMELLDSTFLLNEFLAPLGVLTQRPPHSSEQQDIDFGERIAKHSGQIDIGQTVVIKEKAIVAVEAMEGTDQCILRGGRIARSGAVVVKTSKPQQDHRFDIPVIGPKTIQVMRKANCSCLAIEAGKTFVIDLEQVLLLANRYNMTIVSRHIAV